MAAAPSLATAELARLDGLLTPPLAGDFDAVAAQAELDALLAA